MTAANPLPASTEGEATYVQDALGIRTKIEIPYLKSLASKGPVAINRAELSVKPIQSASTSGITNPPPYLVLLETDATNRLFYEVSVVPSAVFNDLAPGTPLQPGVSFDRRSGSYTWKIATHLNAVLSGAKKTDAFLVGPVYTPPLNQSGVYLQSQYNNLVSRLLLSAKKEDVKLIVFYTQARE